MTVRLRLTLIVLGSLWTPIPAICAAREGAAVGTTEWTAADAGQVQDPNAWIAEVCSLIFRGDVASAGKRLQAVDPNGPGQGARQALQAIVSQYRAIEQTRQAGRHKVYSRQLVQLERLRTGRGPAQDPNDPNAPTDANQVKASADPNRPTDVNDLKGPVDFNDPNGRGIASVL
jgi:hypothetical protein